MAIWEPFQKQNGNSTKYLDSVDVVSWFRHPYSGILTGNISTWPVQKKRQFVIDELGGDTLDVALFLRHFRPSLKTEWIIETTILSLLLCA